MKIEDLKPYLGRIIWSALGLITAILFLNIGFFKTLVIIICFLIGYLIGIQKDGVIDFKPKIKRLIEWLKK